MFLWDLLSQRGWMLGKLRGVCVEALLGTHGSQLTILNDGCSETLSGRPTAEAIDDKTSGLIVRGDEHIQCGLHALDRIHDVVEVSCAGRTDEKSNVGADQSLCEVT